MSDLDDMTDAEKLVERFDAECHAWDRAQAFSVCRWIEVLIERGELEWGEGVHVDCVIAEGRLRDRNKRLQEMNDKNHRRAVNAERNGKDLAKRFAALWDERDELRTALRNYAETYPTCPCGAWIGDEDRRPHALSCPVAKWIERERDRPDCILRDRA